MGLHTCKTPFFHISDFVLLLHCLKSMMDAFSELRNDDVNVANGGRFSLLFTVDVLKTVLEILTQVCQVKRV